MKTKNAEESTIRGLIRAKKKGKHGIYKKSLNDVGEKGPTMAF